VGRRNSTGVDEGRKGLIHEAFSLSSNHEGADRTGEGGEEPAV